MEGMQEKITKIKKMTWRNHERKSMQSADEKHPIEPQNVKESNV